MRYKLTQNNVQLFSHISKMKAIVVAVIFFSLRFNVIFCDDFDDPLMLLSICECSDPMRDVVFARIGQYRKELRVPFIN